MKVRLLICFLTGWLLFAACSAVKDRPTAVEPYPPPVESGPDWLASPQPVEPAPPPAEREPGEEATLSPDGRKPRREPVPELEISLPEEQGMNPQLLEEMDGYIKENNLSVHSVLILRNGYLVHETYFPPYHQDSLFYIFSVTKSVVSALAGIAMDEGLFHLHEPSLLEILPLGSLKTPDSMKEKLNLEHLLAMTSGLEWDEGLQSMRAAYETPNFVENMINRPLMWEPGSAYHYCSGCSHLITAALEYAAAEPLLDFAESRLFEPLGIQNYLWDTDSQGIPLGGWGLHMRARDMAKFGQLYLQEGKWKGEQIISQEWVRTSTDLQVEAPGNLDYGYHWWVHPHYPNYAAIGLGGQMVLVFPARNLVIVFTAENNPPLLGLVDAYIIPSLVAE